MGGLNEDDGGKHVDVQVTEAAGCKRAGGLCGRKRGELEAGGFHTCRTT